MEIKATTVFEQNYDELNKFKVDDFTGNYQQCLDYCKKNKIQTENIVSNWRYILNQGGSRSSKTYSICQALILFALENPNIVISVVRKTLAALKSSAMKDFFEVLRNLNIYDVAFHNKTANTYRFPNGSEVEFFGADDQQKLRGRKRHICWINEANEVWEEDLLQLNLRTVLNFILDFNPSDRISWLYDLDPNQTKIIKSTYLNNPFLNKAQIIEIQNLINKDEALYTIFALGERAITRENIFSGWEFVNEKPEYFQNFIYGIDYGFVHPTALVKVYYYEDQIFLEECIYDVGLTSNDLVNRLKALGIDYSATIVAETARPEMSEELRRNNFTIINADKSFKSGVNDIQQCKVYTNSKNIYKEYENYTWKKVNGKLTEEPTKILDDALDATRYAVRYITKYFKGDSTTYTIS